jgi:putative transposase
MLRFARLEQPVDVLATINADEFAALTEKQRTDAVRLEAVLQPALRKIRDQGLSIRKAAAWLVRVHGTEIGRSEISIQRDLSNYLQQGLMGLVSGNKGRPRRQGDWESLALEYFTRPSKLAASTIAEKLRDEHGFADATDGRVKRFLDSVPAHLGEFHPRRVGPHFRRLNLKPHVIRDRSVVAPGLIYQGDGHSLHYYVRHPEAGHHITAELTPWMDIGSRYIAGWWLGYSESAVQTLYSLSHAILLHDHVPQMLHVDPGSGFKNKMMCDQVAGFAPRLGDVQFMTALPGNARGKGDIEGWFRWFEEKHGKFQASYKGKEVPQEFLRRLAKRIEAGEMYVPHWEEALDGIARYIDAYNKRNQAGLGKRSPQSIWETKVQAPLHLPPEMLMRPSEIRKARSYRVSLWNRVYEATELQAWEGRDVRVEYDLHNAQQVWLYDLKGRFIARAQLVEAKPWLDTNRIADLERKRLEGQVKRLDQRRALLEDMARPSITAEQQLHALENLGAAETLPEEKEVERLQPLDLLSTDYLDE